VLRIDVHHQNLPGAGPSACRLELRAEVRDRSGAPFAKASGASDGDCLVESGGTVWIDFSALAGPASDALRRALADQGAAIAARFPALPAVAEAAPARAAAPAASPPWLASGAQRERRLAVLEFGGPLETAVLAAMSDEARSAALEAVRAHRVTVMTRESMQVVLAEMGRSAQCVEGECEVETARNIGADLVVTGTVLRLDGVHVLTLKLHETARGTLLATASARGKTGLETLDAVRPAAAALFR
jgi:hypothetical protein